MLAEKPYSGGVINPKPYLNHELGSKFFFLSSLAYKLVKLLVCKKKNLVKWARTNFFSNYGSGTQLYLWIWSMLYCMFIIIIQVYLAERISTKQKVAIKVVKKSIIIEGDDITIAMLERDVYSLGWECRFSTHSMLIYWPHIRFIARLYTSFQTPERIFYVSEYISGGDLMHHIMKVPKNYPLCHYWNPVAESSLHRATGSVLHCWDCAGSQLPTQQGDLTLSLWQTADSHLPPLGYSLEFFATYTFATHIFNTLHFFAMYCIRIRTRRGIYGQI